MPLAIVKEFVVLIGPVLFTIGVALMMTHAGSAVAANLFLRGSINLGDLITSKLWLVRRTLAGGEAPTLDYITVGLVAIVALLLLTFGRPMASRPAILSIILLSLTFVAAPNTMMTGAYVDARLPIAIGFFTVGVVSFRFRNSRAKNAFVVLLAVLILARSGFLVREWRSYARAEKPFLDAFACLPPNAVLFSARGPVDGIGLWSGHWQPPIKHVASLATVTNNVFVPQTWAHPDQQPILLRPAYADLLLFQTPNPLAVRDLHGLQLLAAQIASLIQGRSPRRDGEEWLPYLLLLEPGPLRAVAYEVGSVIATSPLFVLYQLGKPASNRPDCPPNANPGR